ncbi:MAG TPA: diguanylate cyclase [Mariprofundaceae bacterium]|nr:diguanylate cyclase [Mariprofundaceae bacterium]
MQVVGSDQHFEQHGHRVVRGFYLIVALFVGIGICLLAVSQLQAYVLDSVRAYVAGEGLWSKGQKEAIYWLTGYAVSHDETDYQAFLDGIAVTLGDRKARLALQQPEPDLKLAREGFLQGGNHPADVDNMISFFLRFHGISYMSEAIGIWTEGDARIADLRRLGEALHAEIQGGEPNPVDIGRMLGQIDTLNRQLTGLEKHFSATLGEAARWSRGLARTVVYISVALLFAVGLLLSWRIVRRIHQTEQALVDSEARFRRVVDSNIIGIMFWDADGRVTDANEAFLRIIGYTQEELEAGWIDWRALTPPEFAGKDVAALAEIDRKGFCTPFEKEFVHKNGHRVVVYLGAARLDGPASRGVSFVMDVSERHTAEQAQRLAAAVFQASTEGIMVTDRKGKIQAVNPAFTQITGYTAEEAIGKSPNLLSSGHHDAEFYRRLWQELVESDRWRGEIWNRRKDGQVYPEWLSIGAIRNPKDEVEQYVGVFSDITDRKEREQVIWHQAHYDILTELPNRALFQDRLSQALLQARRQKCMLALMFIDLDDFKEINDSFGHKAGDNLLQEMAVRLRDCVRESDTVARLGGDEFTIVLPNLHDLEDAERVAEQIVEACSRPWSVMEQELSMSVSIGIALYPQHATSVEDMMHKADLAMYAAKHSGRRAFRYYDDSCQR